MELLPQSCWGMLWFGHRLVFVGSKFFSWQPCIQLYVLQIPIKMTLEWQTLLELGNQVQLLQLRNAISRYFILQALSEVSIPTVPHPFQVCQDMCADKFRAKYSCQKVRIYTIPLISQTLNMFEAMLIFCLLTLCRTAFWSPSQLGAKRIAGGYRNLCSLLDCHMTRWVTLLESQATPSQFSWYLISA